MPTALQEIGFDCCLIFTWNPRRRFDFKKKKIALVFIIFYGDSAMVFFEFYPRGGRLWFAYLTNSKQTTTMN